MPVKNFNEIKEKILNRIRTHSNNSFPQTILIDNISFCNLRCSMCPHQTMSRKKGIMDIALYKKVIDEISKKSPQSRVWITFFGEGLMLKDLSNRIKYAKDLGLKDIVLNSNGNLLKYENSVELVKSGLDSLYIGVDAYTKETYEKVRVGGNLDNVVKGVLEYKRALTEYGNGEQKLFVQFVEMDENSSELKDFIEFWNERSIHVKVRPKVSWAGKVSANNLKDFEERLPCFWAMNTINIADNGLVCLCSIDLDCQVVMGDLRINTIEEIWNTELKSFRDNHINRNWDSLPVMCKQCRDWQSGYAEYI